MCTSQLPYRCFDQTNSLLYNMNWPPITLTHFEIDVQSLFFFLFFSLSYIMSWSPITLTHFFQEEDIKLKPVIAFDCGKSSDYYILDWRKSRELIYHLSTAEIRERDWCNVVTCHMDTAQAYVWRLQNFVLGEHILKPSSEKKTPVKVRPHSTCNIINSIVSFLDHVDLKCLLITGVCY